MDRDGSDRDRDACCCVGALSCMWRVEASVPARLPTMFGDHFGRCYAWGSVNYVDQARGGACLSL